MSALFVAVGVLECNLAHRRYVAVLCILFKIKGNTMHHLSGALSFAGCAGSWYSWCFGCSGTRLSFFAVGLLTAAEPLCHSQCLLITILVTLCLMVWDWRVERAEKMLSCWPKLLFLFVSYYLIIFILPYGLVVLGWGHRIHRIFSLSPDHALLNQF